MSDFNRVSNEDQDHVLLTSSEDANLNSLLADEVVMQWLMDLEGYPPSDAADIDAEAPARRMHA